LDSGGRGLASPVYVIQDQAEENKLLSQNEAEEIMNKFLATFISDDGNMPEDHKT
jgi:hypothetical protein